MIDSLLYELGDERIGGAFDLGLHYFPEKQLERTAGFHDSVFGQAKMNSVQRQFLPEDASGV